METIYIAEIVYSELGTDDKYHIDSMIKAFADAEQAQRHVDGTLEGMKGLKTMKPKFGRVYQIEKVAA